LSGEFYSYGELYITFHDFTSFLRKKLVLFQLTFTSRIKIISKRGFPASKLINFFGNIFSILYIWLVKMLFIGRRIHFTIPCSEGPGCSSGNDAGLTNQTSLVRFPSPLNFSQFHVILIRFLSCLEPTIIWKSHYNISKMVL